MPFVPDPQQPTSRSAGPTPGFVPDEPEQSSSGGGGFSIPEILKQYVSQVNPATMVASAAHAVTNPSETWQGYTASNADLAAKAEAAFKKGNYTEGVRHSLGYLLNGIPGLGAAIDRAGDKAQSGDTNGAIADTAALATQIAAPQIIKSGVNLTGAGVRAGVRAADARFGADAVDTAGKWVGRGAGAVVGGKVGHVVGIPEMGAAGGAYAGQEAVKNVLSKLRDEAPGVAATPTAAQAIQGILPSKATAQEAVDAILPAETVPSGNANPYAAAARLQKSNQTARFIHQGGEGIHSSDVANFTPEQWDMAAKGAGVTKLSKVSQATTLKWLKQYEAFTEFNRARQAVPPMPTPAPPEGLK
jgi:hypothetical protein